MTKFSNSINAMGKMIAGILTSILLYKIVKPFLDSIVTDSYLTALIWGGLSLLMLWVVVISPYMTAIGEQDPE